MFRRTTIQVTAMIAMAAVGSVAIGVSQKWEVHDPKRPMAPVVTPGANYGDPPSDAIVLFDGKDLSHFVHVEGGPAKWKVENGYVQVTKTGSIRTKEGFGDIQLHIEWMSPDPPQGASQKRGNSGIFLMGKYEVQVLDSYNSPTYADGQAASLYGQHPPLVNACRPPGQWQTYDIIFRAPVFDGDKVVRPARATVIHNGVVVQDAAEFTGPTGHKRRPVYETHPAELPFTLQDHNDDQPLRYRNIWVRKLGHAE
jgi:hypothetical protein